MDGKLLPGRPGLTLSVPSQEPLPVPPGPLARGYTWGRVLRGPVQSAPGRAGPLSQARLAAGHPARASCFRAPRDPLRAGAGPSHDSAKSRHLNSQERDNLRATSRPSAGAQPRPESPPQPHLVACRTWAQEPGSRRARLYPARDGQSH